MREGIERGSRIAAARGRIAAGMAMPRFEGWAGEDMRATRGVWRDNGNLFETFIRFIGDRTWVSDADTVDAPAPFHYPWAKHTPGARPHRVWLFSKSGAVTEHRRKLIRWLKLHGEKYDWSLLPDAPEKELWNKKHEPGFPPPFIEVAPAKSATPYLDDIIARGGDPLATWLIDSFWPVVKRAWERSA